jgi:hypothetical protein
VLLRMLQKAMSIHMIKRLGCDLVEGGVVSL